MMMGEYLGERHRKRKTLRMNDPFVSRLTKKLPFRNDSALAKAASQFINVPNRASQYDCCNRSFTENLRPAKGHDIICSGLIQKHSYRRVRNFSFAMDIYSGSEIVHVHSAWMILSRPRR